ncbi:hypothetical protein J6590_091744 [Homalodisca vitripennis]|nr:hypothetical protein J6590_091744 [Homalodisca vitripennis]
MDSSFLSDLRALISVKVRLLLGLFDFSSVCRINALGSPRPGFHRLPSREYAHVATGAPTPLPTEHFLTKDRSGWLLNQYMTYASAETSSHQLSPTPDRASSAGLSTPRKFQKRHPSIGSFKISKQIQKDIL